MHRTGDLDTVCRAHLFTEKIIVTPHASGARQLRERCARGGTPWLNLHARSVEGLARHILGDAHPLCRGRLTRGQAIRLLGATCDAEQDAASPYTAMKGSRGFHRALLQAIEDCRLAGQDPASLPAQSFPERARGTAFRRLAAAFSRRCRGESGATRAELITAALSACRDVPEPERIIIVERSVFDLLPSVEKSLLEAAGTVVLLQTAQDTARRLHFARAQRMEWEIRAAFRVAAADGGRWEDTEIILLRRDMLSPVYELSRQLDIPCTFDPGVPLHYSKAARTVTAYLRWISTDFDAAHLIRMMYDGVPDFSEWKSAGIRGGRLSCAMMLREAAVGWGRERYLPRIDAHIRALEERAVAQEHAPDKQVHEYRANRAWIARLLEITPQADATGQLSLHAVAGGLRVLVTEMSRDKFPGEQQALEEMARLLDDYRTGIDLRTDAASIARIITADIHDITFPLVLQEPGAEPLRVTTPQPGHLHISLAARGGYSGRSRTFILGADADTLPQDAAQNPVLLDSDRRRINTGAGSALPLAADAPAREGRAFEGLLQRLKGDVHISWSERDARDDTPRFPSRLLVDLFRQQRRDASLQADDLRAACGAPAGAAPDAEPLSMAEWWLAQRRHRGAAETRRAMRAASSLLEHGSRAEEARRGTTFTVYDGLVPAPPAGHAIPVPIAVSRLEALAACPYRFFLRDVLLLSPPEPREREEEQWLDPAQTGQAVHRILHRFIETLQNDSALPVREAHADLLARIRDEVLARYATRIPVPGPAAREASERRIRDMLSVFLREEVRAEGIPFALERSFGASHPDDASLPALRLRVPGGELAVSGTIDRLDRLSGGGVLIRDYKTGRKNIDPEKGLDGGRVLQHAVYTEAARVLMPEIEQGAPLAFEYLYISEKEQGSRVPMPDASTALAPVLGALRALIATGVYPHTTRKGHCRGCAFAPLCDEADVSAARSAAKLANTENTMLEPYRGLQHD